MANNLAFGLGAALIYLLIILTMIPFIKDMFKSYFPNTPYIENFLAVEEEEEEGFFGGGQACREGGPDGIPCPEGSFCSQGVNASGHRTRDGTCSPIYM